MEEMTWQGVNGWRPPDEEPGYSYAGWSGAMPDAVDSQSLTYWMIEVSERLPGADPATVATMALHCLRAMLIDDGSDNDNGPNAQAAADLADADTLTRWQRLATMQPGDVNALAAMHAWVKSDQASPDHAAPAPDAFTGQAHETSRTRSRNGRTSVKVRRRGVAQVHGSWRPYWSPRMTACDASSRAMITWWLNDQARRAHVRRGTYGTNVIALQRATRQRYGNMVPTLLGNDVLAPSEVIDAGSSAIDTFGVTIRHDDIGGYASTRNLRAMMTEHNWKRDEEPGVKWPTVHKLRGVRARRSDKATAAALMAPYVDHVNVATRDADRMMTRAVATGSAMFIAAARMVVETAAAGRTTPDELAWRGHRLITRVPGRKPAKTTRTVDGVKGTAAAVARRGQDLAPAQRLTCSVGPWHGSITRSKAKRWNATLRHDDGRVTRVNGARTYAPVAAALLALPV